MSIIQPISRIFCVLLVAVFMLRITPAQAQTVSSQPGLSPADWTQISALMPATSIDAQQAYVKASNTGVYDGFGTALAISGDTLVVGAPDEASNATGVDGNQGDNSAPNAGAVYVFTRSGATWSQQAYLKASNADAYDHFGYSVAISGDTLVVGATGEATNATGVDGNQADNSAANAGAVYVFTRSGTTWSQQAYLKASNSESGDYFGVSVTISGDTLVVGATGEASNATGVNGNQADNSAANAGAAYVFTRSGITWSQQAYLKASNSEAGDYFGLSINISNDTLVVGAFGESSNATGVDGDQTDNSAFRAGAAYVFTRSGTTWSQQAYLKASNTAADDHFGGSVAISGETLVVGADQGYIFNSGAAYVFTRSGSIWSQQAYLIASNADIDDDRFGESVAIFGDRLLVGATGEDSHATNVNGDETDNNATDSGAAYVFTRNGTTWGQQAYLKASNTHGLDNFGNAVAISGETLVAGAPGEDSSATGVNGDQTNDSAVNSGAAYVLVLPPLVVSSLPTDANPTPATSMDFSVTFSEAMTGVEADDFALTTTGDITGESIIGISGGPTTYTVAVTIAAGSGEGTIRLDVQDDDSILSVAASTPLGGTGMGNGDFAQGQFYIIDKTPPTVFSINLYDATHPDSIDFTVTFPEPVNGADATDFRLTTQGITGAYITNVECSNYNYGGDCAVSVNTGLNPGSIRLDLVDDDSIVDLAGNPLGGAGTGNGDFNTGQVYTTDRIYDVWFVSTPSQDGWVLESSENSNKGGKMNASASTFQLGDDASNRQYRAILSFNTASLPNNAVIKSASMTILQSNEALAGSNPFKVLGSLWADIRKGSFGSSALQLSDFSAPASATRVGSFTKTFPTGRLYTLKLNAAGRSKINKLGLTQFRLYFAKDDNDNHKADFMKFWSENFPTLYVTYSVP